MTLVQQILGGLVRLALSSVFGWLIHRGIIGTGDVETIVVGITGLLIVAGWTVWQKLKAWEWLQAALALPSYTPVEELRDVMKRKSDDVMPIAFLTAALATAAMSGCASVPLKQQVSATHQTVRQAIVSVDDAERAICAPLPPPQSNRCGNALAASIGLTDQKHQTISKALAEAYAADVKAGAAIIAWRAGDPVPTEIAQLLRYAQEALAVASTLSDRSFIDKAETLVARAQRLVTAFKE